MRVVSIVILDDQGSSQRLVGGSITALPCVLGENQTDEGYATDCWMHEALLPDALNCPWWFEQSMLSLRQSVAADFDSARQASM